MTLRLEKTGEEGKKQRKFVVTKQGRAVAKIETTALPRKKRGETEERKDLGGKD